MPDEMKICVQDIVNLECTLIWEGNLNNHISMPDSINNVEYTKVFGPLSVC